MIIETVGGIMRAEPKTTRGERRAEFSINKNTRKKNLARYGVRKYSDSNAAKEMAKAAKASA